MKKMHWLAVIMLSVLLFTLTSLYSTNSICCMFVSVRSYGFPGQFVVIGKETDSLNEAQKVKTLSTFDLLNQGWRMRFAAGMESPVSQSAPVNVIVNVLLYFIISFIGVSSICRNHKKNMNHRVLTNVVFNALVAVGFVMLNIWALDSGLEETFITLAILYGVVTILGNALLTGLGKRNKKEKI